jgi:hypothetical protein
MFGIYEIIGLMLALGGFGVEANPKAPSADVVLEYAMPDADVVAYVDAAAIIPKNYQALLALPDAPQIKASPALRDAVRKAIAEVDGPRGMAKATLGVDFTTDLSNVTAFVKLTSPSADPEMVFVARGKVPADLVDRISKMVQVKPVAIDGTPTIQIGGDAMLAVKNGAVLVGTPALIKPRVGKDWKSPKRDKGSILAETARVLETKPFYMVSAAPSGRVASIIEMQAGPEAGGVARRFAFVAGAAHHNGISWVLQDKNKADHLRSVMMSEGAIDIMRAAHLAPRGFAKVFLSVLDDIKSGDRELTELKKYRGEILKLVDGFLGDGKFNVKYDKNPGQFRVAVRATGKSLGDVVPFGLVAPGMAMLMLGGEKKSAATPMPPPPPPRSGGGITAPPPRPDPRPKAPAPPKPK